MNQPPLQTPRSNRPLALAGTLVALVMIAYHILNIWFPLLSGILHQNAHLGFCLVLLPLAWAFKTQGLLRKALLVSLIPLGLALVIYVGVHYERLDMFAGFPEPMDELVGVMLIILVIAYTWKSFGPIFPVMVILAIGYAFFGQHIPGVMGHTGFEFGFIVSNLSIGLQGIYGMLLSASANILFLLLIFGATFEATGVTSFFTELGNFLGRHFKGGSGHTAIFSSSFVGMVNGAAAANVAITGSYTIPVMKKTGYRGETAAGIEAMASTGGQLTPPIMGIAVFIMAGFLGVSYADLMFKALIPAIAYYLLAVITVIIIARRENIPKIETKLNRSVITSGAPVFLVPISVLTYILVNHYSAGYAAFWGIVTILAISLLRKETRPRFGQLVKSLVSGSVMAATFGIAVACIGMLIKIMTFTAANTKLSLLISAVSGGYLLPVLLLTMLLSILLSSSTPTVIAYIIVAFVAAPILIESGISPPVAHFFVYYYAILAAVTPPVAGAAMVGCQIAQSSYMKAAWESFKLVGPFFLLPYFLIRNPVLFMGQQEILSAGMALLALTIALLSMMCFCQRFCLCRLQNSESVLFLINALLASWFGLYGNVWFFLSSLALTSLLLVRQLIRFRQTGSVVAAA